MTVGLRYTEKEFTREKLYQCILRLTLIRKMENNFYETTHRCWRYGQAC